MKIFSHITILGHQATQMPIIETEEMQFFILNLQLWNKLSIQNNIHEI